MTVHDVFIGLVFIQYKQFTKAIITIYMRTHSQFHCRVSIMYKQRLSLTMTLMILSQYSFAASDNAIEDEINQLLNIVEKSQCIFTRNGSDHDANSAKSHLQLKYRKGKKYVHSSEQFIDRLASESSWTGKNYTITCPEQQAVPSGEWLHNALKQLRNTKSGR